MISLAVHQAKSGYMNMDECFRRGFYLVFPMAFYISISERPLSRDNCGISEERPTGSEEQHEAQLVTFPVQSSGPNRGRLKDVQTIWTSVW